MHTESTTVTEPTRNEVVLSTTLVSVLLAFLSSLIITAFIGGCFGGYFLNQRCKKQLHEGVQQPATLPSDQDLEQSLEMKDNVAYGPLQSIRATH